jgi:thiol:disulfide interchange protein DsbD
MNHPLRSLVIVSLLVLGLPAVSAAKPWWLRGTDSNEGDFLPPDEAFRVKATVDGSHLLIRYAIANGYYLYRQKMEVAAESPDLTVGEPQFPAGTMKTDPYLGTQEIFTQRVQAQVPFQRQDAGAHPVQIKLTYQGCAEAGLCYPPIVKVLFPGVETAQAPTAAGRPPRAALFGILGGVLAFLAAGLWLRKGRRLDSPA